MVVVIIGFAMAFYVSSATSTASVKQHSTFSRQCSVMSSSSQYFLGTRMTLSPPFGQLMKLLVAVLSTSHAQVQDNVARESKVSKARMIEHYQGMVQRGNLPSPMNMFNWS